MNESISTFLGYEDVTLPQSGKTVRVKQLPVRQFPALAAALEDEPALVEICTELPADEIDALPIADFEALYQKASEANLPPFYRWVARRKAEQKALGDVAGPTSGASGASTSPTSA